MNLYDYVSFCLWVCEILAVNLLTIHRLDYESFLVYPLFTWQSFFSNFLFLKSLLLNIFFWKFLYADLSRNFLELV